MTQEYADKVKAEFLKYKKLLKLPRKWNVEIKVNDELVEYANVEYHFPSKLFTIQINPKKNHKIDDLRDSIIHEILHILLSPLTSKTEKLLEKISGKKRISVNKTQKQLDKLEEGIVRQLSHVLFDVLKGQK